MNDEYKQYGYESVPDSEYGKVLKDNFKTFIQLQKIIETNYHEWRGCGSYLMNGGDLFYDSATYDKQEKLFEVSKQCKNFFEVGVHAGHSLFLMLLANPEAKIWCVDLCEYSHVEKCIDYLNSVYDNKITFIKGGSPQALEMIPDEVFSQIDLFHIDGAHDTTIICKEIEYINKLYKKGSYVVFDDFDAANISDITRQFNLNPVYLANCQYRNLITQV